MAVSFFAVLWDCQSSVSISFPKLLSLSCCDSDSMIFFSSSAGIVFAVGPMSAVPVPSSTCRTWFYFQMVSFSVLLFSMEVILCLRGMCIFMSLGCTLTLCSLCILLKELARRLWFAFIDHDGAFSCSDVCYSSNSSPGIWLRVYHTRHAKSNS